MAYSAVSTDGGMRMANVPADATVPPAKLGSYPWRRISGMATRENVAASAMDEPQMPPKSAQAAVVALARAPRKPENTALAASNSSWAMIPREATAPISRNNGTTEREYALARSYGTLPSMRSARLEPSAAA